MFEIEASKTMHQVSRTCMYANSYVRLNLDFMFFQIRLNEIVVVHSKEGNIMSTLLLKERFSINKIEMSLIHSKARKRLNGYSL